MCRDEEGAHSAILRSRSASRDPHDDPEECGERSLQVLQMLSLHYQVTP